MGLTGWDIDGVLTKGRMPGCRDVVISGRVFSEYDSFAKRLAQVCPVYIRGTGVRDDLPAQIEWKIEMIRRLKVTTYHESEPRIARAIRRALPNVKVIVPSEEKASETLEPAWSL